jgi:hypothetical protein
MGNLEKFLGQNPELRKVIDGIGDLIADDVAVVILPANVTPAPTAAVWTYSVPFEIRSARTGEALPVNGVIGQAAADTSQAGTAAVSAATVPVRMGRGIADISGDAANWLHTETATLTLTYTNLRGGTDTDAFVITFTTP